MPWISKTPITPDMRLFLLALADLMEEHGVEMAAEEVSRDYSTSAEGVCFTQDSVWSDAKLERPYCDSTIPAGTNSVTYQDLREFANLSPPAL